jgi:putative nucleotidyltransferase with HDIG domain
MWVNRSTAITRLSRLPSFHPTALLLLAVSIENPSAVADFELAFQGDPALASRLLTMVNSPLYGFRVRVRSIRQAIDVMGLEGIRSLVFTLALGPYLRGAQSSSLVGAVWNHSLATAVIAETIGAAAGQDVSFLYMAGLLHDVGRMGLLSIEGQRYAGVLQRKYFDIEESLILEGLLFGCAHDDAGAFLGRWWGFPEPLCDCIRRHHQPEGNDLSQQIVQLACHTAGSLGMGEVQCERNVPVAHDDYLADRIKQTASMHPDHLLPQIHSVAEALVNAGAHPEASPKSWTTS